MSACKLPFWVRPALVASFVLLPAWIFLPRILDGPRFGGALFSILVFLAAIWMRPRLVAGTGWFLLAIGAALPMAWIHAPAAPWGGFADRAPWLAAWVAIACLASDSALLHRTWRWVLTGLVLAAVANLFFFFGIDLFWSLPGASAARTAPFAGSNHAVEVLAPAAVAIAARRAYLASKEGTDSSHHGVALSWLGAGALSFAVGLHGTLAGWISLPLGLLWVARREGARLLVGAMLLALFVGSQWPAPETRLQRSQHAQENTSIAVRWQNNFDSLGALRKLPFGLGLGQFELRNPEFRSSKAMRLASQNWTDPGTPRAKDPHLEPMLVLLEFGWLGAIFFLLAFVRLLRFPLQSWVYAPLLVLFVHALVRSPWSDNEVSLALTALLLATRKAKSSVSASLPWWRGRVSAIGLAALAACFAIPQMAGEWLQSRSLDAQLEEGKVPVANLEGLEAALRFRPWDARAWCLLAAARGQAGAPADSIREALDAAFRADPANLFALTARIKLEMLQGQIATGLLFLRQAEATAPEHPAVLEARSLLLEDQARLQKRLGTGLLTENPIAARPHLLVAHTLTALVAARRGDLEAARGALRAAQFYVAENRPMVARLLRDEKLNTAKLHSLATRILPEWQEILGPG